MGRVAVAVEASFVGEHWWQVLLSVVTFVGAAATVGNWLWPRKRQIDGAPLIPNPYPGTLRGSEQGPPAVQRQSQTVRPTLPLATHFVERKELMDQVLRAASPQQGVIDARTAVVWALHGMGSVGKTELVREVARRLNCSGGTAEVNLRGWDSIAPM